MGLKINIITIGRYRCGPLASRSYRKRQIPWESIYSLQARGNKACKINILLIGALVIKLVSYDSSNIKYAGKQADASYFSQSMAKGKTNGGCQSIFVGKAISFGITSAKYSHISIYCDIKRHIFLDSGAA